MKNNTTSLKLFVYFKDEYFDISQGVWAVIAKAAAHGAKALCLHKGNSIELAVKWEGDLNIGDQWFDLQYEIIALGGTWVEVMTGVFKDVPFKQRETSYQLQRRMAEEQA